MKKMLAILCSLLTPILPMHARGTNPSNGSSSLGQGTNPASTDYRYNIGDFAQGGVVIWVTTDGQHGLVAAIEDQGGAGLKWSNDTTPADVGADNNNPLPTATPIAPYGQYYGGYLNQQTIEQAQDLSDFPAFAAAANYSIAVNGITYSDWFLPSYRELLLMYSAVGLINQVSIANGGQAMRTTASSDEYWSSRQGGETSTTSGEYGSWMIRMVDGLTKTNQKRDDLLYVRCVRAF